MSGEPDKTGLRLILTPLQKATLNGDEAARLIQRAARRTKPATRPSASRAVLFARGEATKAPKAELKKLREKRQAEEKQNGLHALVLAVNEGSCPADKLDRLVRGLKGQYTVNSQCYSDNCAGRTPLAYAVNANNTGMVHLLLDNYGADPNVVMGLRTTVLTLALRTSRYEATDMVRTLLSKGADPDPVAITKAGVDLDALNLTVRYWLQIAQTTPAPPAIEGQPDFQKLQKKAYELHYAIVGERVSLELIMPQVLARFSDPQAPMHKKPLVMMLMGPPGHGKTFLVRNLANTFVGAENMIEIPCGGIQDKADLFGGYKFGESGATKDGSMTAFLRGKEDRHTIVFLDEFEKVMNSRSGGWEQATKIYQAFLEPWQEGKLTDFGSRNSSAPTIDVAKCIFILTSNWGEKQILAFAEQHRDRVYTRMLASDAAWVRAELVYAEQTGLRAFLQSCFENMKKQQGDPAELAAIVRRIDVVVPFLPLTKQEQLVVTDTVLRNGFARYRAPAVRAKPGHEDAMRAVGNVIVNYTDVYIHHAASQYRPMEGASSLHQAVTEVTSSFMSKILSGSPDLKWLTADGGLIALTRSHSEFTRRKEPQPSAKTVWVHWNTQLHDVQFLSAKPPEGTEEMSPRAREESKEEDEEDEGEDEFYEDEDTSDVPISID